MFDAVAAVNRPSPSSRAAVLPVAALLHLGAFSVWALAGLWQIAPVPLPVLTQPFVVVSLPPSPAAPPRPAPPRPEPAQAQAAIAPVSTPTQAPTAPPTVQPTTIPTTIEPASSGAELAAEAGPLAGGPAATGVAGSTCIGDCGPAGPPGDGSPIVISVGVTPPQVLNRVLPAYPELCRRMHRSGRVVVDAVIDAQGSVQDARARSTTSGCGLEASALSAVRQWRFAPAHIEGRNVAVYFTLNVDFGLR